MTSPDFSRKEALSRLHHRLESGQHPEVDAVRAGTRAWAQRLGLLDKDAFTQTLSHTDSARYAALVHWDDYSRDSLQLLTDYITWLYFHDDDGIDNQARELRSVDAQNNRLVDLLHGAPLRDDDDAITRGLADILERLAAFERPMEHFVGRLTEYLTIKSWEASNHSRGVLPEEATYSAHRSLGGGVYTCFEAAIVTRPIELTPRLRHHALVEMLAFHANCLASWANDIASVKKEVVEGCTTNLVLVLRGPDADSPWQPAVDEAISRWNQRMKQYTELREQLLAMTVFTPAEQQALQAYLRLMEAWVQGTVAFHTDSQRFERQ